MRNILIHADDGPGMPARLESGLAIGRRHRSHLDLLISSPFQQFIATDPFGGMYLASEQLAKAQAADMRRHLLCMFGIMAGRKSVYCYLTRRCLTIAPEPRQIRTHITVISSGHRN